MNDPDRPDGPGAPDDDLAPPPLSLELEAMLGGLAAVAPRRPWRDVATVTAAAAASVAGFLLLLRLRRDLAGLPAAWVVGFAGAWLGAYAVLGWLALVPRPGDVMPRWLAAVVGAAVAAVGFVGAGLALDRAAPTSLVYAPTVANHLGYAALCLGLGLAAAALPLAFGLRALRGAVPVGARGAGAGLGAAGGAAGGFMLHLHCPIAHPYHVGFGHGGVVLGAALVGALLAARLADQSTSTRSSSKS